MANSPHNRVPSGWPFLDEHFGGVFENEPVLLCGPSNTGKTSAALQWACEGLLRNEPTLYFTSDTARTVYDAALRFHLPVKAAIDEGKLILIESTSNAGNGSASHTPAKLAAQRVAQIQSIIQQKHVRRMVIDSLLPWVIPESPKIVAHLITEMISKFQAMHTTGLFTLPRPTSGPAIELLHLLQDQLPIGVNLIPQSDASVPLAEVVRYAGHEGLPLVYSVKIGPGEIMVSATDVSSPKTDPQTQPATGTTSKTRSGIRFSDEII